MIDRELIRQALQLTLQDQNTVRTTKTQEILMDQFIADFVAEEENKDKL